MCETLRSIFFLVYLFENSFFEKSTNYHTAFFNVSTESNAQCNTLYNELKVLIFKDRLVLSETSQELSRFHREKAFLKKTITSQRLRGRSLCPESRDPCSSIKLSRRAQIDRLCWKKHHEDIAHLIAVLVDVKIKLR